jgi:hypothetical protein
MSFVAEPSQRKRRLDPWFIIELVIVFILLLLLIILVVVRSFGLGPWPEKGTAGAI